VIPDSPPLLLAGRTAFKMQKGVPDHSEGLPFAVEIQFVISTLNY